MIDYEAVRRDIVERDRMPTALQVLTLLSHIDALTRDRDRARAQLASALNRAMRAERDLNAAVLAENEAGAV